MAIRTARLAMRMDPKQKRLIEDAAGVLGQDVSNFAVSTLVERAQAVLEKERRAVLSQKAYKELTGLLEKDTPSISALREVVKRLKPGREH